MSVNKYKKTSKLASNLYLPKSIVEFIRREGLNTSQLVTDLLHDFLTANYGHKYQIYLNAISEADKENDKEKKAA